MLLKTKEQPKTSTNEAAMQMKTKAVIRQLTDLSKNKRVASRTFPLHPVGLDVNLRPSLGPQIPQAWLRHAQKTTSDPDMLLKAKKRFEEIANQAGI